jgi:hypothetical protein
MSLNEVTKRTPVKNLPSRLGGVAIAILMWVTIVVSWSIWYSHTPSDPQKPIGYLMIAIYAFPVAGAGGLAAYLFSRMIESRSKMSLLYFAYALLASCTAYMIYDSLFRFI